jgi:hypothetical protein
MACGLETNVVHTFAKLGCRLGDDEWNVASAPRRPTGADLVRPVPTVNGHPRGTARAERSSSPQTPRRDSASSRAAPNLVTELRANHLRYYDPNRKGFFRFDALHAAALLGIAKISTLHAPQRREPAAVNRRKPRMF